MTENDINDAKLTFSTDPWYRSLAYLCWNKCSKPMPQLKLGYLTCEDEFGVAS